MAYAPALLDGMGLGARAGLLPPLVDGARARRAVAAPRPRRSASAKACRWCLGPIDIVATGLGAGLYDPERDTGCTVVGSTGIHMRVARSAEAVRLNPDSTGYTLAFPVPGTFAQLQSNMASTLNIDWLVDLARGVLRQHGVEKSRADIFLDLDDHVLAAEAGTLLYHPYISEAGERGPFVDAAARAAFHGLSARHDFNDLMRAVYEGLGFAARDCYAAMGEIPSEVRITGGAARSKALRAILGAALGTRIRTSIARGGRRGRRRHGGGRRHRPRPDMESCIARWVTPTLGEAQDPDPALADRYDRAVPRLPGGAPGRPAAVAGHAGRARRGRRRTRRASPDSHDGERAMTDHGIVDLAIIGGGVNGAGIARDAAGRGLKVLLCEKGDLAEGTSLALGQARARRAALPRILRVPPRARGADRARGAAARGPAHHLAHALRAAALARAAPGLDGARRPVPLRPPRRPQDAARLAQARPAHGAGRARDQAKTTPRPSNIRTAGSTTRASWC